MEKKFLGLVLIGLLLAVSSDVTSATVYPSYNTAADCRGCHGSDVSDRHHLLVVNGTFQCTDCHPVLYDNISQTYSTQVIRNCLTCHPGKNHTDVHHLLVAQGLFVCSDCHPIKFDNVSQTYYPVVTWDCTVCHSTVFSIQNVTPTPTLTPDPQNITITNFTPGSPVNNFVGDFRNFNIIVDQIANITWFINGTQVQFNGSVTSSSYTNTSAALGTWNVSAAASNIYGNVTYTWIWVVISPPPPPVIPSITNYFPFNSPVNDFVGSSRKFGITIDQNANTQWLINGSQAQFNGSVDGSSYTNTSAALGTWNVSAIVSNTNGTVAYSWIWIVVPVPPPPVITSSAPFSLVNDTIGASRTYNISTDQIANITWFINGTQVQSNGSVTSSSYTNTSAALGTWNVSAIAINTNGSVAYSWVWNVIPPIPSIIYFSPSSPVNDTTGNSRNFTIATNQTANITWYINNSQVQSNNSVMSASFNIASIPRAYLGTSNVSAVASNIYGSDIHTWIWNVSTSPKTPIGLHAAVDCSVCHVQKPTEVICYQCHNNSANSANGTNIYLQFTMSNNTYPGMGTNKGYYNTINTRHDITDSDQNYSSTKLECTACHSAHNASRTNVVINPKDNTSFNKTVIHPGTGKVILDYVTFCLKCHDNTWSPNVIGPSIISNISYWYLMNLTKGDWHGAASGDKYNNTFLIGPYASQAGKNYVNPMPCNDCHDSHGSGGLYHLKTLTDQYGINMTITSANVNSSDVAHWCSHCHKDPMQQNTSRQTKGSCLSSHCHSHGNRF